MTIVFILSVVRFLFFIGFDNYLTDLIKTEFFRLKNINRFSFLILKKLKTIIL
jgi:hypothetical protein